MAELMVTLLSASVEVKGGEEIMEKKKFTEPLLEKYEEKLDEVTRNFVPGSCPEDGIVTPP